MAKKKNNGIWWVLGLGTLAWLFISQNKAQAQTPAPAAAPPALPPGTASPAGQLPSIPINPNSQPAPSPPVVAANTPPVTAVVSPTASPVQANPPTITSSIGPIGPGETTDAGVPYDPRMSTLQTWAQNSLNACDLARWNANQTNFTAQEWNGLYDLYFNDWIGGQGNTAARVSFWNAWRTKYKILTNTPC